MSSGELVEVDRQPMQFAVVRSVVPKKTSYLEYKEELRLDFWFSCAYCTMSEAEAAGYRFTIDHYEPQSSHPALKDDYNNLMYCCDQCNMRKSDLVIPKSARDDGYRFYRPDSDHFDDHFSLSNIRIEPKSPVGEWTESQLDLNRAALLKIRELRRRLVDCHELVSRGVRGLKGVKVDQIHKSVRGSAVRTIKETLDVVERLEDNLDAIMMAYARSPLLDIDEQEPERSAVRKRYLSEMKALYPGTWRGRQVKAKTQPKR